MAAPHPPAATSPVAGAVILGEPRAAAAAAARRLGLHYLQRYFFLIAFRCGPGAQRWRQRTAPRPLARWLCPPGIRIRDPAPPMPPMPVASQPPPQHPPISPPRTSSPPHTHPHPHPPQGVPGQHQRRRRARPAGPLLLRVGDGAAGAQVPAVTAGHGVRPCRPRCPHGGPCTPCSGALRLSALGGGPGALACSPPTHPGRCRRVRGPCTTPAS